MCVSRPRYHQGGWPSLAPARFRSAALHEHCHFGPASAYSARGFLPSFSSLSAMGCCGDPVQKDDQYANRPQSGAAGIVQQQPGPQPAAQIYEKPALLSSSAGPSPPPPTFQTNHHHGPVSQWGQSPPSSPPPVSIRQPMLPSPYDGHAPTPLYQPRPIHIPPRHASTSPSIAHSMTHTVVSGYTAPPDEGRMSISIDFGAFFDPGAPAC